jgi:hypothetical protein
MFLAACLLLMAMLLVGSAGVVECFRGGASVDGADVRV